MTAPSADHRPDPIRPEARAFQGLRAGVVSRTVAGAIDYVLITSVVAGTWVAFVVLTFLIDPRDYTLPVWPFYSFVVYGFVLMGLYLALAWATTGRTLGNRLLGLRVVGRKGHRVPWPVAVLRALLCTLVPVTLYWCVISRENRSVADVLLRTSVIHDWPVRRALTGPVDADSRSDLG